MKREFLTQFMERLIVELEREQRDGTAHVYQSTLKRLKKFTNGREVSFKQLTPEWLAQFERKLLADQLKWNSICLLYTSPSPRDVEESRMPSSA